MSVNLQLTANASGDNFTIVESGSVVNVYYNQPETGTLQSTVAVSDLSSITINGVGADTVTVDTSGGNPLPSAVTVASGAITFNQDLGAAGDLVDLTVASGAAVNFGVTQHLDSLTVASGASVNMVGTGSIFLNTQTLSLNGAVNLQANTLLVTTPNASNTAIVGATTNANSGVNISEDVVTTTVPGTVIVASDAGAVELGNGTLLTTGTLVAIPITGVVTIGNVSDTGGDGTASANTGVNANSTSVQQQPNNAGANTNVQVQVTSGGTQVGSDETFTFSTEQSNTVTQPNGQKLGLTYNSATVGKNGNVTFNFNYGGLCPGTYTGVMIGSSGETVTVTVTITQ